VRASLQAEAERARQRLEVANKALVTAPSEKNRALLATTLGLPAVLCEIVPALLFSTALNGVGPPRVVTTMEGRLKPST
jgi:hypothetical protein